MVNNYELFLEQENLLVPTVQDYEEAWAYHTTIDFASVVDQLGVPKAMLKLLSVINNPAEQHALLQLCRVIEQADNALYHLDPLEIK